MDLVSRLRNARRYLATAALLSITACGSGEGGKPTCGPTDACNKEKPTITITSVPSGLEGTVGNIIFDANRATSMQADDPDTPGIDYSSNGTRIEAPYTVGYRNVTWNFSATNANGTVTDTRTTAATPLIVSATWDKPSVVVGQTASCKVDAPPGTQKVYARINAQKTADINGNTATFPYTPTSTGEHSCEGGAINNAVTRTSTLAMIAATAPPIPTGQLRISLSKDSILAGLSAILGAKISVQDGKADSVVATGTGFRATASGDSLETLYSPTQSGPVIVTGYFSRQDGSAPGTANGQKQITLLYSVNIQLVDMDGQNVTQPHTMSIAGREFTSSSTGMIAGIAPQGVARFSYARRNANDTTATRLELPATYQNATRIIFPRFKINQTATTGEDTVTVNSHINARAVIAGLGNNFNKEHHAGYFDDQIYGQQGPRTGNVRFHILTQPDSRYPLCQAMAPSTLATWRQFQTNQLTELQGYYAVANSEGALPQTLTSGDYVVLCQGPVVGAEIFREPANGTFKTTVAYIFSNSPMGEANTEALQVPYGSSGIEGKCTVRSVFNDPNPSDPLCSMGTSPTATAYDRREGLDMVRDFATPANNRALITPTIYAQTFGGPVMVSFSLRKN